jgi:hypothetical protein
MPETVEAFINSIPPLDDLRERELLRRIIRIAEQREKVARTAKRGSDCEEG